MGTPDFAVPSLVALTESGFKPVAVVTGQDKRRGRGNRLSITPVKQAAVDLNIETILQPASVKSKTFAQKISDLKPDLIIVVAFRILPPRVFECARLGAFNLHGSLLPKYRGAAPIHHAVLNGDSETGVTTFFLKQKVDTGNIILKKKIPIAKDATTGDVHDVMKYVGAGAVVETTLLIEAGDVATKPQNDELATPAPKVYKSDAGIPWDAAAEVVHNHIRGYSPVPGAWTFFGDTQIKVIRSTIADNDKGSYTYGQIIAADHSLIVACGKGAVEIVQLQQSGRRKLYAREFLRGNRMKAGDRFQSLPDQG